MRTDIYYPFLLANVELKILTLFSLIIIKIQEYYPKWFFDIFGLSWWTENSIINCISTLKSIEFVIYSIYILLKYSKFKLHYIQILITKCDVYLPNQICINANDNRQPPVNILNLQPITYFSLYKYTTK